MALIGCAVTAHLICAFVFAYAKSRYDSNSSLTFFDVVVINLIIIITLAFLHHHSINLLKETEQ